MMAIASALGVQLTVLGSWLFPATLILIAASIALSGWTAHARRRYAAFAAVVAGAAILLWGRTLDSRAAIAGAMIMVAAAAWIGRPMRAWSS